jgi:hypothetical protein
MKMCLNQVDKVHSPALLKERWAWKVFDSDKGQLEFPFSSYRRGFAVPVDVWIRARRVRLFGGSVPYTSGFHAYVTRDEARRKKIWGGVDRVIRKVKLRKVRIEGTQERFRVLVADEMFVPTPVKRKKTKDR